MKTRFGRIALLSAAACAVASPGGAWAVTRRADVYDNVNDFSNSPYLVLATLPEYSSVGKISSPSGSASGVLVGGRWVLTAGHVGSSFSSMRFFVWPENYVVTQTVLNPNWNGNLTAGNDVALLKLEAPVTNATPATRYWGSSEVGQSVTLVGDGWTGTGLTGYSIDDTYERAATNVYDHDGAYLGYSTNILVGDFDDPGNADNKNTMGASVPTTLEGMTAPGDSGGGTFIGSGSTTRLVGIHSFIGSYNQPFGDGNTNASYSDHFGDSKVSAYNDWIDDTIASYWTNPAGGSTGTVTNWIDSYQPGAYDIAAFNLAATYTVTVGVDRGTDRILVRKGNVTFNLTGHTWTTLNPAQAGSVTVGRSSGDSATFTVTNGTLSSTDGAVATQAGSVGQMIVGSGGTWNLSDTLYVSGNAFGAGGTGTVTVQSGGAVHVAGNILVRPAGTLSVSGTVSAAELVNDGNTTLGQGGSMSLTGGVSGSSNTTVGVNATLSAGYVSQNALTIHGDAAHANAVVSITTNGGIDALSVLSALAIDHSGGTYYGSLDLKDNNLVIRAAPGSGTTTWTNDVLPAVLAGFNGGAYGQRAITSSTATSNGSTVLAAVLNDDGFGGALFFNGSDIGAGTGQTEFALLGELTVDDIIIKYTYYGDFNLDGAVDGFDQVMLDTNFGSSTNNGWAFGDVDFNGTIDGLDQAVLDIFFGSGSGGPSGQLLSGDGPAAIPEPATLWILLPAIAFLHRRRRGRAR